MKKNLAIITFDDDTNRRYFIDPSKITRATYASFKNCDWDYDMMGLKRVGKNEEGEELFESIYSGSPDFEGQKTWKEIEGIETDWYVVNYWDGNNHQTDVFEYYDKQEIEIEALDPPSPAYYFSYILILEDGEKVNCSKSNMIGSLSPYYCEDIEY